MKPGRSSNWIRVLLFFLTAGALPARGDSPEGSLFESQVRPLLADKCFKCHSHDADKIKSGLVLDSLAGALQGGDSGKPAIVPHDPKRSELLIRIRSRKDKERMPPKGERLTERQTAILEEWINQGAPWPQSTTGPSKRPRGPITDEDRSWWAFQPLAKVKVPRVKDAGWSRTEIDRFIFEKLAANRLTPTPPASRSVLVRRLYFDLWGLPPSAREIDEFVADPRPDAYEALVDRLLASPHYGERWARHWLDLVRYADSDGYKADDFRPTAWLYRDYVIRSLNADRPYDRFVREQLAGDELYPDEPDARIATGYFRNGIYEYNNRDVAGQWTTILNDVTDTTGDVFFGLGFQCARCHDHKFDPILQKDYYRLQAFFAGIQWHDDLPVAAAAQNSDYAAMQKVWEEKTATLREAIETIEAPYKAKAATNSISKFPPEIQAILRKPSGERSPLERQLGELAYRQVTYEHDRIAAALKPMDKETVGGLRKELSAFDYLKPAPLPTTLTVTDLGPEAPPTVIPKRTNEVVEPGFLTLFDPGSAPIRRLTQFPNSTGRRAALAEWLTRPENPLSVRVIVNRVWQYHFGRGLVPTSSDFGHLGEKPSHPELLDWLAQRFIADGWSLKKLHRLILTSATYRQASSVDPTAADLGRRGNRATELTARWKENQAVDPENRLLWRGQTRRLDAEQIRDALLCATGELKDEPIGPAADPSQFRRSIYTKVLRNTRDPLLEVFDLPQHFASTPSRDTTTTPVQSLMLINSPFMLQRSRAMARRVEAESAGSSARAIELA
ncbi:MAG TPA: PSD1 and planctomycete cytochrome C domain-containing protein, partial [Verrucomicrobiota bacterium]|nr:PSD1 and planctomycete cytochrome C domain-containing protein [Verrucomicrobiota bacterium]